MSKFPDYKMNFVEDKTKGKNDCLVRWEVLKNGMQVASGKDYDLKTARKSAWKAQKRHMEKN
jgi:hypothetical protein